MQDRREGRPGDASLALHVIPGRPLGDSLFHEGALALAVAAVKLGASVEPLAYLFKFGSHAYQDSSLQPNRAPCRL